MEPPEPPHLALFFVLTYLPLHQLLSMRQVCKSLSEAVTSDMLIWLDIVVESPLNFRLTDQILMRISSKAHGKLRTLALLNCVNITDDGLLAVVNANPLITKLYVPGCTSLTPEGLIKTVNTLTEKSPNTLTTLKINGIYNLKEEHLHTLQSNLPKSTKTRPRFYHKYNSCSFRSLDKKDDHAIDVNICPKCKQIKLVFDCTKEHTTCWGQQMKCRGCGHCVPWCEGCGKCIIDQEEQGETVCNHTLCLDCWLCLPKCNLCNKAFCCRPTELFIEAQSLARFVCDVCHTQYL